MEFKEGDLIEFYGLIFKVKNSMITILVLDNADDKSWPTGVEFPIDILIKHGCKKLE